jgi:hypothetical protein
MGDKSLETELESRKQSMMGAINKAVAYTNFIDKNYANFYMSQDKYDDDVETATNKRNAAYENLTIENLNNPEWLTQSAVEFSPREKVKPPNFLVVNNRTLPYLPTSVLESNKKYDNKNGVHYFSDEAATLKDFSDDVYEAAKLDPDLDLSIKIRAMRKRDPDFQYNASTVNDLKKFDLEDEYRAAVEEYAKEAMDVFKKSLDDKTYKEPSPKAQQEEKIKPETELFLSYFDRAKNDNYGTYIEPVGMKHTKTESGMTVTRGVKKMYFGTASDIDSFRVEFEQSDVPPLTGHDAFDFFKKKFGEDVFKYIRKVDASDNTQTNTQQQAKSVGQTKGGNSTQKNGDKIGRGGLNPETPETPETTTTKK